jgi:hypothetical protein
MLEESGGELTPEIEEALTINEENFVAKVEGYCEVIAKYKAAQAVLAERIKQLTAMKRTAENIEARMKERLAYGMNLMGRDRMEMGFHKISFRSSQAVNILNEAHIPNHYVRVETKIDKESLKRDLKAGLVIEGAELITNKSIQIR